MREWSRRNKDKVRGYQQKAAESRRRYSRKRYAKQKVKLQQLKDAPCTDCGGRFPPECMDFDHVRGVKHFCIGRSVLSMKKMLKEINKCELVCANCHRIRTKKRRARHA